MIKITIVTPSLNQGKFIEETIQSILNQNYPYIEHLIIDGGSSDNTIKILKKYDKKIKWMSEKDNGTSNAINKGLKMASGDIIGFLNSDDLYSKDTLKTIGNFFSKCPEAKWVTGDYNIIDEHGNKIQTFVVIYKRLLRLMPTFDMLCFANFINYPSTFIRRDILKDIGFFDENLYYSNDYDYWLRIIKKYPLYTINKSLSVFRIHKSSTGGYLYSKQFEEKYKIVKKYSNKKLILLAHKIHNSIIVAIYNLIKKF